MGSPLPLPRLLWWFNNAQNGHCPAHMSWGATGQARVTALRQLHSARRQQFQAQRWLLLEL